MHEMATDVVLNLLVGCLIIDGQALVVFLGRPDNAVTFGDLADTYSVNVNQCQSIIFSVA